MMVYAWEEDRMVRLAKEKNPFADCQVEIDEPLFRAYQCIDDAYWALQEYVEGLYYAEMDRLRAASILAAGEK
ncbi:MAG: hypothetical protein V1897_04505 [Pseudomonadota bacterium]